MSGYALIYAYVAFVTPLYEYVLFIEYRTHTVAFIIGPGDRIG